MIDVRFDMRMKRTMDASSVVVFALPFPDRFGFSEKAFWLHDLFTRAHVIARRAPPGDAMIAVTLTCPICMDVALDTMCVPCGHTVCRACVEAHRAKNLKSTRRKATRAQTSAGGGFECLWGCGAWVESSHAMYLPAPDQVLASRDVDVDADATRSSSAVAPTASSPASDGDVVSVSSDGDLVVVSSLDDEYLGRRVEVYWPNDDPPTWYPGVVARFDPNRQHARYRVDYDDGADEWVDFPEPTVRFVSWSDWAREKTAEELVEWTGLVTHESAEKRRERERIYRRAKYAALTAMERDAKNRKKCARRSVRENRTIFPRWKPLDAAAMKREREERNRKLTRDRALKAYQAMSVDERRIYLWLKRESST